MKLGILILTKNYEIQGKNVLYLEGEFLNIHIQWNILLYIVLFRYNQKEVSL